GSDLLRVLLDRVPLSGHRATFVSPGRVTEDDHDAVAQLPGQAGGLFERSLRGVAAVVADHDLAHPVPFLRSELIAFIRGSPWLSRARRVDVPGTRAARSPASS